MPKACDVCGKAPQIGNSKTTRGKAKYLGGVGTKITGISRRQFKPNLQRVRITVRGTNKTVRVCTQCLRSGAVTKQVKAAPFKLPSEGSTGKHGATGKLGATGKHGATGKGASSKSDAKAKAPNAKTT